MRKTIVTLVITLVSVVGTYSVAAADTSFEQILNAPVNTCEAKLTTWMPDPNFSKDHNSYGITSPVCASFTKSGTINKFGITVTNANPLATLQIVGTRVTITWKGILPTVTFKKATINIPPAPNPTPLYTISGGHVTSLVAVATIQEIPKETDQF